MKKVFYRTSLLVLFLLQAIISYTQTPEKRAPYSTDSLNMVWADVMDDGAWCRVSWNWNTYYWEFIYDDGEADDFFVYAQAGSLNAVRFTPTGSPTRVVGGKIYVGDGSFPGPFLGTVFRVIVFDDDGTGGLPGTALDSMTVTVCNYFWVEFEGLNAIIPNGDFYLAYRQLDASPNAAPVGIDTDNPTYNRSYVKFLNNEWQLSAFQDYMIRAWISDDEEDSSNYIIDRFSNFDPNGSPLLGDMVSLDTTDLHFYNDYAWDSLAEGWYAYGVMEVFAGGGTSGYVISNIVGHFDTIPSIAPSCFYQADTGSMPLVICPPYDSTGSIPFNFVGYKIYLYGDEVDVLPPEAVTYLPDCITPCKHTYSITAVYDLAPFGYPGEYWESMEIPAEYIVRYGFPLDFLEDWGSGSFDTNSWTTESENWIINVPFGNPSPTAEFNWNPVQINYNIGLESYPLVADSMFAGRIYLDFDIKLDEYLSTGTEKMDVGIWEWESQEWMAIDSFSNAYGSFDWLPVHLDISERALGKVFKIKFSAKGEASLNILSWFIDNIHVYRECAAPTDLELEVISSWELFKLTWDYPPGSDNQWIQWDDGVNYTSIGTIGPLEFDVAARWEPDQLKNYPDAVLKQVAFFPAESISTYSIRVWTGDAAQNMVVDQPVEEPAIDQWNFINLNTPLPIDTSQVLWIGYHMNSVFGYPAGVDNGPAIDGYGNMINHYGWKTLLQMNPDLDYNFNIEAFIEFTDTNYSPQSFSIYRSDDGGPWFLRDTSHVDYYLDDSVCFATGKLAFEYKVKALYIEGNDSCESDFSNEVIEVCEGINEDKTDFYLHIYPNPGGDYFKVEMRDDISLKKPEGDDISNAKLLNSNGEIIWEKEIKACSFILPVADYPEGMYLLRIETGKGVVSGKVVIMR